MANFVCGSVVAAVVIALVLAAAAFAAEMDRADWVVGVLSWWLSVSVVAEVSAVCAVVPEVEEVADPVCVVALCPVVLG